MTRITSTILVFMILLNGGVTIMEASGMSDDIGVTLAPGVDDAMDGVVSEMKKGFSPDVSVIESLISMLVAGGRLFKVVIEGVFAAPAMFMNLGFPEWIVIPLFAPTYLISALELMYIFTGRRTV